MGLQAFVTRNIIHNNTSYYAGGVIEFDTESKEPKGVNGGPLGQSEQEAYQSLLESGAISDEDPRQSGRIINPGEHAPVTGPSVQHGNTTDQLAPAAAPQFVPEAIDQSQVVDPGVAPAAPVAGQPTQAQIDADLVAEQANAQAQAEAQAQAQAQGQGQ